VRLAVLDVGSNTIHLAVADMQGQQIALSLVP